jgi:hypothetical protein
MFSMPDRKAFEVPATSLIDLPSGPVHSFASFTMKRTPFLWRGVGRSGSLLPIGTSANDGAEPGWKSIQPTSTLSKSTIALKLPVMSALSPTKPERCPHDRHERNVRHARRT